MSFNCKNKKFDTKPSVKSQIHLEIKGQEETLSYFKP